MTAAKFITFEGGEGAGKSTQAKQLAERLRHRGIDVLLTREPGGSPFAEQLRSFILDPSTPAHDALSEALLFYAARADHLDAAIRPALKSGRWVICDRFSDSTRVYQGVAGGLAPDRLEALEDLVVGQDRPHLTVVLDLDPSVGLSRVGRRGSQAASGATSGATSQADRFEARDLPFHRRLRAGYVALAEKDPQRCLLIDAEQPPDAIAAAIWQAVQQRLLASDR
jgi:dTMP kinase